MPLLHLRITGTEDDVRLLTDLLNDVDGIERIEEIADLMPHMDDEVPARPASATTSARARLEIEVPHAAMLDKLRDIIEAASDATGWCWKSTTTTSERRRHGLPRRPQRLAPSNSTIFSAASPPRAGSAR
jgi:hypothetical protein